MPVVEMLERRDAPATLTITPTTLQAPVGTAPTALTATGAGPSLSTYASGLNFNQDLAFDAAGNLYVANQSGSNIIAITPQGKQSVYASGFTQPKGLAFDSHGNLFVSNQTADTISEVPTGGGTPHTFWSGHTNHTLGGVIVDQSDNVYVTDQSAGSIVKINTAGAASVFASGLGSYPRGLAFDSHGNLFVSIEGSGAVKEVTPAGAVSTFVQSNSIPDPAGLAFDSNGNLYVSDYYYQPGVYKITPGGTVTTLLSGLKNPTGLAVDHSDNLYISLGGGNSVDKLGSSVPTFSIAPADGAVLSSVGLALNADGSFAGTVTAAPLNNPLTFTVNVTDGAGDSGSATITLFVWSWDNLPNQLVWTGQGGDGKWSNPNNWANQDNQPATPTTKSSLVFPSGAGTSTNNDISGLTLDAIYLKGNGYTLTGDAVTVTLGLGNKTGSNVDGLNVTLPTQTQLDVQGGTLKTAAGTSTTVGGTDVVAPGAKEEIDGIYTAEPGAETDVQADPGGSNGGNFEIDAGGEADMYWIFLNMRGSELAADPPAGSNSGGKLKIEAGSRWDLQGEATEGQGAEIDIEPASGGAAGGDVKMENGSDAKFSGAVNEGQGARIEVGSTGPGSADFSVSHGSFDEAGDFKVDPNSGAEIVDNSSWVIDSTGEASAESGAGVTVGAGSDVKNGGLFNAKLDAKVDDAGDFTTEQGGTTDIGHLQVDAGATAEDGGHFIEEPGGQTQLQPASTNLSGGEFKVDSGGDAEIADDFSVGAGATADVVGKLTVDLSGKIDIQPGANGASGGDFKVEDTGEADVFGGLNEAVNGQIIDAGKMTVEPGATPNVGGDLEVLPAGSLDVPSGASLPVGVQGGGGSAAVNVDPGGTVTVGGSVVAQDSSVTVDGTVDPPTGGTIDLRGTSTLTVGSTGSVTVGNLNLADTSRATIQGMLTIPAGGSLVTTGNAQFNAQGAKAVTISGTKLNWAQPAAITFGTALSAAQLDATASVPGTFVYTPADGTVLSAGSQTLQVSFTPTNQANAPATGSVILSVGKTTPTVTVSAAGGTFTGNLFAATARVAGLDGVSAASLEGIAPILHYYAGSSVTGTPLAGAPTGVGNYTVVAAFGGSLDYTVASSSPQTFTIAPATPTVIISARGGSANGRPFAATTQMIDVTGTPQASLEGVAPTLSYYAGSSASGKPLAGPPSAAGTYTVLAEFPGSADYAAASATQTFKITAAPVQLVRPAHGALLERDPKHAGKWVLALTAPAGTSTITIQAVKRGKTIRALVVNIHQVTGGHYHWSKTFSAANVTWIALYGPKSHVKLQMFGMKMPVVYNPAPTT
jgi:sugar lactone lactonase YvrE